MAQLLSVVVIHREYWSTAYVMKSMEYILLDAHVCLSAHATVCLLHLFHFQDVSNYLCWDWKRVHTLLQRVWLSVHILHWTVFSSICTCCLSVCMNCTVKTPNHAQSIANRNCDWNINFLACTNRVQGNKLNLSRNL